MALVSASALSAITTEFDAIFNDVYKETPVLHPKFSMPVKSNTATSVHSWMLNIPGVREWVGPRHIHDVKGEGYSLTNKTWENTLSLKKSDIEDDQVGLLRPAVQMLAYNAKAHPDQLAVDLLKDNGTCYDGSAFFASRSWQGRTVTNTGALSLDAANFETTKAALRKICGQSGASGQAALVRNLTYQIVVGPDLESTAARIVDAEFDNFGATNINKGRAELIVLDDLVDAYAGYWFVFVANSPVKPLLFQERTGDVLTSLTDPADENVFMRREYLYGWERRYAMGYGLWQLAFRQTG